MRDNLTKFMLSYSADVLVSLSDNLYASRSSFLEVSAPLFFEIRKVHRCSIFYFGIDNVARGHPCL
jgi:hypothetical protein